MTIADVRIAHVAIDAPAAIVYAFAANPENLPRWAPGFAHAVTRSSEDHVVETPDGPHVLRFCARNDFGVLDHWVYTPDGTEFYNPMRVVAHGAGCLVAFTLFRQDGWSDDRFARDAALASSDLERLKAVVETDQAERAASDPLAL